MAHTYCTAGYNAPNVRSSSGYSEAEFYAAYEK